MDLVPEPRRSATSRQDLFGRKHERERIEAFVAGVPDGLCGLVIRGEAGIGKSACWRYAVGHARAAGWRVLTARPAEEERGVSWNGLVDLFGQLDDLGDHPLSRGRAALDVLRGLAAERPTVLAIDDVPWLDSVSAQALRHALRRLDGEPIGVLATYRTETTGEGTPDGTGGDDPLVITTTLPPHRVDVAELGPLDPASLREVLAGTVPTISRPKLTRIHELSGGNPLYALELARCLADWGRSLMHPPLPVSLRAAIGCRLDDVPARLSSLVATVAATGPVHASTLHEILAGTDSTDGTNGTEGTNGMDIDELLVEAERLGLLVVDEDLRTRFTHPLLGSVVYARMSPLTRRALHARLAATFTNEDVRARHLALCTDRPDATVAGLLESAAERARRRGASDIAADFGTHSLRLTAPDDHEAIHRRSIAQVAHLAAAGEVGRALDVADRLVAEVPGPARADALVRRFYVDREDYDTGADVLAQALAEVGDDDRLRGRVLDMLGWVRGMFCGALDDGIARAREAVTIAARVEDTELEVLATAHLIHMRTLAGTGRPSAMADVVARAEAVGAPRLGACPRAWLAKQLLWDGDLDAARELVHRVMAEGARTGNELERPYRLYDLALIECAAGELGAAQAHVRSGTMAARDAENRDVEGWLLYPRALVQALSGHVDAARTTAHRLATSTGRPRGLPATTRAGRVLGLLALSQADAATAARELTEAARLLAQWGVGHPGAIPVLPDAIEALAGCGNLDAASSLLRRLERETGQVRSEWALAQLTRSRAVVLLAERRSRDAASALATAAEELDRLGHRVDAARTVLLAGRALLRCGRRTHAARHFVDACERFTAMGATLWAARARSELERAAPGRATGKLTRTERKVARLVADGCKNVEVAQQLFLGVATVEAHLTRIYRKLDLRSRSELTRLVADGSVEV